MPIEFIINMFLGGAAAYAFHVYLDLRRDRVARENLEKEAEERKVLRATQQPNQILSQKPEELTLPLQIVAQKQIWDEQRVMERELDEIYDELRRCHRLEIARLIYSMHSVPISRPKSVRSKQQELRLRRQHKVVMMRLRNHYRTL